MGPEDVVRWRRSGYGAATKAEQAEWDRFLAALGTHEDGHTALVTSGYTGIAEAMAGKTEAAGNRLWNAAVAKVSAANVKYDATTQHGVTQGTDINLP